MLSKAGLIMILWMIGISSLYASASPIATPDKDQPPTTPRPIASNRAPLSEGAFMFKMLTVNVQQFTLNLISKHNRARARELTRIIRDHHTEFDVIGFQELWSNKTRHFISKELKELYPYKYVDKGLGAYLLGYHSGLALYSKYPIKRHKRHTYKCYRDVEHFAKKGLLAVELDANGQSIVVALTHLQAADQHLFCALLDSCRPGFDLTITQQILEANHTITKFRSENPTAPAFLMGDFNIAANSELYHNALMTMGGYDTFSKTPNSPATTLWQNFPEGPRIDYIWSLNEGFKGSSQVVEYFSKQVTDHLGVTGRFTITRPAPAS